MRERTREILSTALLVLFGWIPIGLVFSASVLATGGSSSGARQTFLLVLASLSVLAAVGYAIQRLRRFRSIHSDPGAMPPPPKVLLYILHWLLIAPLVFLITLHILTDLPLLLIRAIWGAEPPLPIHFLENGVALFGFAVSVLAVYAFWRRFKSFAISLVQP